MPNMNKQEYERLVHYSPEEEAPTQIADHNRVMELEARIVKLEAALDAIIACDTAEGLEGHAEFFAGISVAETALKELARKAVGR